MAGTLLTGCVLVDENTPEPILELAHYLGTTLERCTECGEIHEVLRLPTWEWESNLPLEDIHNFVLEHHQTILDYPPDIALARMRMVASLMG